MKWIPLSSMVMVYLIDVITKLIVVKVFVKTYQFTGESVQIIGNFLQLRYIENQGIAFGLFSELQRPLKDILFTSLSMIAVSVVIYFFRITPKEKILSRTAFALILSGALGNLTDKIFGFMLFHQEWKFFYGSVVDFIDVGINKQYRWPTFNVADIAITVGFIFLLYAILIKKDEELFAFHQSKTD